MSKTISPEEQYRLSDYHRENQRILRLDSGGQALQFHDTIIIKWENGKVTYSRNPTHINEATRHTLKYYSYMLFRGCLVVKNWKTERPLFILNGVSKEMVDNQVEFEVSNEI